MYWTCQGKVKLRDGGQGSLSQVAVHAFDSTVQEIFIVLGSD